MFNRRTPNLAPQDVHMILHRAPRPQKHSLSMIWPRRVVDKSCTGYTRARWLAVHGKARVGTGVSDVEPWGGGRIPANDGVDSDST